MFDSDKVMIFRPSGKIRVGNIRNVCPRCHGHEASHPRHPWDCDITPTEWREFYQTPWPALYMLRQLRIRYNGTENWS